MDLDPLFMARGHRDASDLWIPGNYHLQGTSPMIDAGSPLFDANAIPVDLDGEDRVLGGVVDVGVDETLPLGPPPTL